MAQKKVHHWKHGWIPLDAFARNILAERERKKKDRDAARRARYNAHLNATAKQRSDMESRYLAHRNDLARKRSASPRTLALQTTAPPARKLPPGGQLLDSLKNDGGFTYDPKKGELVKVGSVNGVAVARPGTEQIVGRGDVSREDFANAVADVIESHGDQFSKGAMLGGWYSEDRDAYMVEVTDVFPDRASAIKAGRDRNQEGVFDLKTGDFIATGGTGDQHPQLALQDNAILNHPFMDPLPSAESSFSASADTTRQLIAPSTGPGQEFWPDGVPAIKDVGVFNAADGQRLAKAWAASGAVLDKYGAQESTVTPTLVSMAAANGGYMQGLEYRLKTRDSLTRKLYTKSVQKRMTPEEYASKIGDALRYTFVADPDKLAGGTQAILDRYRKQGYTVEVENTWGLPDATYRGINTNITKDGRTFEVQFHTPQSFEVKMAQHDLYDIARSNTASPEAKAAANAKMQANMASLVFPKGIVSIR